MTEVMQTAASSAVFFLQAVASTERSWRISVAAASAESRTQFPGCVQLNGEAVSVS